MIKRLIKKYGYRVTMIDRRPFGMVTMRFLEPKNIIGYMDTFFRTMFTKTGD